MQSRGESNNEILFESNLLIRFFQDIYAQLKFGPNRKNTTKKIKNFIQINISLKTENDLFLLGQNLVKMVYI